MASMRAAPHDSRGMALVSMAAGLNQPRRSWAKPVIEPPANSVRVKSSDRMMPMLGFDS